jgi:hypothetical protein
VKLIRRSFNDEFGPIILRLKSSVDEADRKAMAVEAARSSEHRTGMFTVGKRPRYH